MSNPSSSNLNGVGDAASSDTSAVSQKPRKRRVDWIIGLDFGTTFSGFAYARASGDTHINVYYDWPRRRTENMYCKTLTGLYYRKEEGSSKWECSSWGYHARSDYVDNRKHVDAARNTLYLTKFKLLLMRGLNDPELAASIPKPFTVLSIITDYLRLIGEHALDRVREHHLGDYHGFSKDLVQWVVTVPSIWDENAKQKMKVCMVDAGLVGLGGIDAVNVVLEPEAASFHCHEILRRDRKEYSLDKDDKILVADIGGGTVDIVVQEMIGNRQTFRVQELTESSGGLCGGTHVDDSFMKFLSQKIPCLDAYLNEHPIYKTRLLKDCEEIKCSFGHELVPDTASKDINLPDDLAAQWKAYESSRGHALTNSSVVELTYQDLTSIFDPVVDEILSHIAAQVAQVSDIKVMFLVGGFADSRYLRQRIRERFEKDVKYIVSPPNPGSAIVQGAVSLGLHPEAIASRIARRTYGTSYTQPFQHGRDPPRLLRVTSGKEYCHRRFDVFVRKGDRVNVDMSFTKNYGALTKEQKEMVFDIWSSSDKEPRYTEESERTTKEGKFAVSLTNAAGNELPRFDMTMRFGRGHMEVSAVGNVSEFGTSRLVLPVKFSS